MAEIPNQSVTPPPSQLPKEKEKVANTAPHRIVNWVAMQDTVNAALDKCSVCKTKGMKLVEVSCISLASTFALECETCNNKKRRCDSTFIISKRSTNQRRHVIYTWILPMRR